MQRYLPHQDILKRVINKARTSAFRFDDPKLLIDLRLPPACQKTLRGENFVIYDSEDQHRIYVFSTKQNMKVMTVFE